MPRYRMLHFVSCWNCTFPGLNSHFLTAQVLIKAVAVKVDATAADSGDEVGGWDTCEALHLPLRGGLWPHPWLAGPKSSIREPSKYLMA